MQIDFDGSWLVASCLIGAIVFAAIGVDSKFGFAIGITAFVSYMFGCLK